MEYVKLRFNGDLSGEGYQELENNTQLHLTDINGNTIDDAGLSYSTEIIEENSTPIWI